MKKILITGAAGFLGSHLEHRLKAEGHFVVSVARHPPVYRKSVADEYNICDLTLPADFHHHFIRHEFDYQYQLAGEVGGLSYIGSPANDAVVLTNSVKINLHTLEAIHKTKAVGKIFFASSQCVYPDVFDIDPFAQERIAELVPVACKESDASFNTFPFAQEKLFSERLYSAYARNYGIKVAIGRIGNTYGPYCTWDGLRAKAPAAICRKIATAPYAGVVDLFGNGKQQRSFTYVDDVIDGMIKLMETACGDPVNIAHPDQVTIAELFHITCRVANKIITWRPTDGPVGVRSRGSDNTLCKQILAWEPSTSLWRGMALTYPWIRDQALTKISA